MICSQLSFLVDCSLEVSTDLFSNLKAEVKACGSYRCRERPCNCEASESGLKDFSGKRLGMLTIYAAYGDRNFFETKKETDFVAEKPGDILRILELSCNGRGRE